MGSWIKQFYFPLIHLCSNTPRSKHQGDYCSEVWQPQQSKPPWPLWSSDIVAVVCRVYRSRDTWNCLWAAGNRLAVAPLTRFFGTFELRNIWAGHRCASLSSPENSSSPVLNVTAISGMSKRKRTCEAPGPRCRWRRDLSQSEKKHRRARRLQVAKPH